MCVLLLSFGINRISAASATSQENSEPTVTLEESLTILNDVVGVDTAKYNIKLDSYSQDLYLEILPQENVKYVFESDESKLEVIYTFVNGKLRSMSTYVLDGTPQTTQPATDMLEMAKEIMNKYQVHSGISYYDTLKPMLDNVESGKSSIQTSENVKLEVTGDESYASFRWTYIINGVEVPSKCVVLYFEQGFLSYFIDTWSLYKIGATDITLSEEEAVQIAMNAAKTYSWNVSLGGDNNWTEVTEFNVAGVIETKLSFGNYIENEDARGGDSFTVYPGWRIRLYLDKTYLGNVYGLDIGIWADTKEVHGIRTMFTLGTNPPSENNEINTESNGQTGNGSDSNLPNPAWIALPIAIGISLAVTIVCYKRKRSTPTFVQGDPKRSIKLGGTLMCLLIALAVFPMVTSTANASRGIIMYGSTWNIVSAEYSAAVGVVDSYEYYFDTYAGYDTFDAFGSYTQKSNVLSWASTLEASFDHVAMFYYGHGGYDYIDGVKHWSYYDNDGPSTSDDYIWDYEVYPQTWRSKTWFVMLWSCRQGDKYPGYTDAYGRAVGMPYAWHHPVDPSYDTFIGFKDASMPLTQISAHHDYVTYNYWLIRFVYHGTYNHYSIIQSLNQASIDYFNLGYYQTELDDGFHAVWPGIGEGDGWMKIYGNPNIYFY